jgi:hypothetical protein
VDVSNRSLCDKAASPEVNKLLIEKMISDSTGEEDNAVALPAQPHGCAPGQDWPRAP